MYRFFRLICGFLWISLLIGAAPRGTARWFVSGVDAFNSAGSYNSIAIDPASGATYIGYYDETAHNLRVASYAGVGAGNCGTHNAWFCQVVDSHSDRGRASSIAIDPTSGYPAIAYYDATARVLRYITYSCFMGACYWGSPDVIDDSDSTAGLDGDFISLKFAPAGYPVIAYHATHPGTGQIGRLKLAQYTNGGNCGPLHSGLPSWTCKIIASSDFSVDFGQYISLAIDSGNDKHITYRSDTGSLWYAHSISSLGNCGQETVGGEIRYTWICDLVDQASIPLGSDRRFAALALGPDNRPYVAYSATPSSTQPGELRFASRAPADGVWTYERVDDLGSPLPENRPVALVMDRNGKGLIAYYRAATLWYAEPVPLGSGSGNCGLVTTGIPVYTWKCTAVEATSDVIASYVAIALAPNDLPTIAYSSYNFTGYDLKVANLRLPIYVPQVKR
jgi:hypothetical protein